MCVKYVAFQAGEACEKAELAEALPSWRSGCFMVCFLWLRRLPALGNPLSRLWLNAGLALTLAWRFLGGFPGASAVLDAAISGSLVLVCRPYVQKGGADIGRFGGRSVWGCLYCAHGAVFPSPGAHDDQPCCALDSHSGSAPYPGIADTVIRQMPYIEKRLRRSLVC